MSEENKDPGIPKARILKSQTQKSQPPGSKIPKTKIKICGLSRMEDIEAVNEACPDYCGFIINYPPSKRNISVDQLAELKKILRKEMKAVGVFVDAPAESVAKLLNENLIDLANFWNDVQNQNVERFSDRILRRLFVLNYAPNGMWTYFVSVYYMANRDSDGLLNDDRFYSFLNKITAFIWAYAVTNPGVNALRTPIFAEMTNIVTGQPVRFSDYLFDTQKLQNAFDNYTFSNNRAITKAMLTWWAFQNSSQELLSLESVLEIEHIYARNRQEKEHSLSNPRNIESLGNKVLLEKRINIRASDYRFSDKVKYYTGFENNRKQKKEGTKIKELTDLAANATDFTESDIVERNAKIILSFVTFMRNNDLLCED